MRQVKSRRRVAEHGEVLTGEREVNAMLDLVRRETERIESRFLEPACGDGNFLAVILARKLGVVEHRYGKSQLEYERYAVLAVSSVYGIDVLADNVADCRERLFRVFDAAYTRLFRSRSRDECRGTVRFILDRNIIWGDALTLRAGDDDSALIVFSEWAFVGGSMLKRRDFTYRVLLQLGAMRELPLFSDLGEDVFIPTPEQEHPPIHFLEIANAQQSQSQP